jgi:hypothetical protein
VKGLILCFIQILICLFTVCCQVPAIESETWISTPLLSRPDEKYLAEPAVTVMNKLRIEFIDDKNKNLAEYYTQHKIVHLNNDQGIEYFNKIYIRVNDFSDAVVIRARVILPGGKVIEVDSSAIKDLKDEDGSLYKIFAFEGLEKGSDIEYLYSIRREAALTGKFFLEDKFPALKTNFELIAPDRLVFESKAYHCDSEIMSDTMASHKARLQMHFSPLNGLDEEKYSAYHINLARVEFKLSYNNATHPGERMFTWNEYAKRIFAAYGVYSDKETKKISELIGANQWDRLAGDSLKVITVENYIKKTIDYRKDLEGDANDNIETILKTHLTDGTGMMRLYGAIYKGLQVNYQFVLAADRGEYAIDPHFENWNNCSNEMIYFPSLHHYIVPTKIQYRYPWIPADWGDCSALFCKNISIGSMSSAIADIKNVQLEDYLQSYTNLEGKIALNQSMDSLLLDMKFLYGGYSAAGYRYGFNFLTDEEEKNAIKEFSKDALGTETILFSSIENRSFENASSHKPFILNLKVRSGDFIERAGNKILLKIGMVIGPQVEMYQEKERKLPMYVAYPQLEHRKIEFIIPEGYAIKNLDDLRLKQVYEENGVQTMGFVSDYTIHDSLLTVEITEDYRKTSYPIGQYNDFRKIINTSSDFNKVVLILEKK